MVSPNWNTLPGEIIPLIGQHLDMKENLLCSLVCKSWRTGLATVILKEEEDECIRFEVKTVANGFKVRDFIVAHKHQFEGIVLCYDFNTEMVIPEGIDINHLLNYLDTSKHLKYLCIGDSSNFMGADDANINIDMTQFPRLPMLKTLSLDACSAFTGDLTAFCEYYSSRLEKLELFQMNATVASTWDSETIWSKLHTLSIKESPDMLNPILQTTFEALRDIGLVATSMDSLQFRTLVNSPRFPHYTVLELGDNEINDEGIEALQEWLDKPEREDWKVQVIDLSSNSLGECLIDVLCNIDLRDFSCLSFLNIAHMEPMNQGKVLELLDTEWLGEMTLVIGAEDIENDLVREAFILEANEMGVEVIIDGGEGEDESEGDEGLSP